MTGLEGNHGEDCKECVYYLDSTPSHSYMKALYKYPQAEYPYGKLVEKRSVLQPELELQDTGIFDDNRYWDIFAEYAKESPDEVLMRITIKNRAPEASTLQFIPQLWYRNTWRWSSKENNIPPKPLIQQVSFRSIHTVYSMILYFRLKLIKFVAIMTLKLIHAISFLALLLTDLCPFFCSLTMRPTQKRSMMGCLLNPNT